MQVDYLLIGHVTADLVAEERVLGGTVSYSAPVAAMFDHNIKLLTSAAYAEALIHPLLASVQVCNFAAEATTTFENIYAANGKRTQYVHAVANPLQLGDIPSAWMKSRLVHLAPLVDEVDKTIPLHFPDATVLLTPQGYLRQWGADKQVHFKRWFDEAILRTIDILVLSKADIAAAPELEQEYAQVVEHVVVTNGENGGTYYHRGTAYSYDPYPVSELDPTGAGDVFAASLLASLPYFDFNLHKALKVAARLAAISVTQHGTGYPFTNQEIQAALEAAQD